MRNETTEMKPNVLIVGAGAMAHVTAHKAAQNNDVLRDICIATRKREKVDKIRKGANGAKCSSTTTVISYKIQQRRTQ